MTAVKEKLHKARPGYLPRTVANKSGHRRTKERKEISGWERSRHMVFVTRSRCRCCHVRQEDDPSTLLYNNHNNNTRQQQQHQQLQQHGLGIELIFVVHWPKKSFSRHLSSRPCKQPRCTRAFYCTNNQPTLPQLHQRIYSLSPIQRIISH